MTHPGPRAAGEPGADAAAETAATRGGSGDTLRLFVALTPPPFVLDDLAAVTASLRQRRPQLRWTQRDGWHITLAFLGAVQRCRVASLAGGLERAAGDADRLHLALAGGGAFPDPARARVLWSGLRGDLTPLAGLARAVAREAVAAGAPPAGTRRRFRPHVTLARCSAAADVTDLVAVLAHRESAPWTVDEIRLVHSRLGQRDLGQERTARRARYLTVGRWPLRTG